MYQSSVASITSLPRLSAREDGITIEVRRTMNEPPSFTRLAPAVVVDAGKLQGRCRIGGALDNQEQHRSRACCVHRQLIKQQPGLLVTRLNPRGEFTALHRPLANRGARQHPHRGAGLRRHDHFEAGILDEELGKPVGVPAVIRVRIRSHLE